MVQGDGYITRFRASLCGGTLHWCFGFQLLNTSEAIDARTTMGEARRMPGTGMTQGNPPGGALHERGRAARASLLSSMPIFGECNFSIRFGLQSQRKNARVDCRDSVSVRQAPLCGDGFRSPPLQN